MARIVITGSSFIRRLRDSVHSGHDVALRPDYNLDGVGSIHYVCRGGWRVRDVRDHIHVIRSKHPDIVVLQIGSNDVGRRRCPLGIGDSILHLADRLLQETTAQFVVLGQCLPRKRGSYLRLRTERQVFSYNGDARKLNNFLKVVSRDNPRVRFWRHKGLTNGPDDSALRRAFGHFLSRDGVHLSGRGQYKLYKSVRGAIKHSMNVLQARRSR